ncbi:F-box protein At3g07870-like [Salvia splendens]|uniref:F-box protein At3g07870-like n=1 Tax=Salvia splendens TaxID=180675 RepID=UPI001C271CEE|nr:F-box protein At3g07870-like [Salvia splendens]XP_042005014.1 F-box protein At3g07870-like [Salvia splendens]
MMNKNSPAALRTSNRHFAKKDRLWRLAVRKQRKRRVALRKDWRHFSKKDLLRHLSVIKEQKPKDNRLAVRKERKRKYILATTKEDRFANLPEEITKEIMGRLPIMSVMTCKCVLKSWRHLIEGDDFGMSYTPKPGLNFIYRDMEMGYTVCDEALKPLFRFASPSHHQSSTVNHRVTIASANGLLSMWDPFNNTLFICNPMTREYVELPPLSKDIITRFFGFGMSKLSGQYKILYGDSYSSCHVYTLGRGTGLWRSVAAAAPGICRQPLESALFYNGNLHWLTSDPEKKFLVCCFDLEAEVFTSFSVPCDYSDSFGNNRLYILEGRLCLCNILDWRRVNIWKINNYGDEKSWIKEYSFNLPRERPYLYVLEVLTNGDLLFAIAGTISWSTSHDQLFIYSKNTEAIVTYATYAAYRSLEQPYSSNIGVYTPSLISLTTLGFHNVQPLSLLNKHADADRWYFM